MNIERIEKDQAYINLSLGELLIINNALNEVCNALDVTDFSTRMGVELVEVRNLLQQVGETIDQVNNG